MAGILDRSTTFIDYKITENGRRQIANGDIRFEYASLSDTSIVYEKDYEKSFVNRSEISFIDNALLFEVDTKTLSSINNEFDLDYSFSHLDGNILKKEIDLTGNNSITFKDASEAFLEQNCTGTSLKNLNLIGNKNYLKTSGLDFVKIGYLTNEFDFIDYNFIKKYPTIKSPKIVYSKVKSVIKDKRFKHKTNFKMLVPVGDNNSPLYDTASIEEAITVDFIYKNFNKIDYNIISNREELINKVLDHLDSSDSEIFKREYLIKRKSDFDSFIINMYETNEGTDSIEKLSFIDLGSFINNRNVSKKVFLVGKLINTKDNQKELDEAYNFKSGEIQKNTSNKNFAVSAFYSFVCMFTIVAE